MGLLSFLQREPSADASSASPTDAASPDTIRTRARRRLIGAAVLVLGAVLALPAIFDTKPRPLPVDIAIEIPRRDGAAAVAVPAPRPITPVVAPSSAPASGVESPKPVDKNPVDESPKTVAKPVAKPEAKPEPKPDTKADAKPAVKPDPAKPAARDKAPAKEDGARAQAMLEGRDAKPAKPTEPATRFVVQVGAFEHADAVRETRQRVEKLGLHTFQQNVDTTQGKRIRVRLGPFGSREEADKAVAKLSAHGIKASVVPL